MAKTTFERLLFLKLKQKKGHTKLVDPQKSLFMSFETKTQKNILHIFFVLALKRIDTQMLLLVNIFFNALTKVNNRQKQTKWG